MTSFVSKKYTDKNGTALEKINIYSFVKDVIFCFVIVYVTSVC